MKILINLILIYCLLVSTTYAQSVNPNDQLKLGKPSSVSDKGIVFDTNDGASNKKLLVEKISKKLKWDGNSVQIGDGSSSSDKELIIAGALKSLKYNGTTGEFEFNDDVKLSASLKTDFLQAVNTEVAINSLLRATQGIKVGSGSNEIRVSGGNLEFSNDGTVFKKFGTGTGGGSTGTTILDNASFEDGISTNWTSSGGTFTQGTYTNGVDGNTKYAQFVATGSGQYFETALFYVPTNFSGGCQADFKKVNVSTNDLFKVEVLDSSANVLSSGNVKASSWVKFPTINFSCPTAGSQIKLRVTSLSAGTIQVDDAYLGSNQNIVNIAQSTMYGSATWAGTTSCTWNYTTATFASASANASCPNPTTTGKIQQPATKIPAIKLPAGSPAGDYYIVALGDFSKDFSSGGYASFRFHDGTSGSSPMNARSSTASTSSGMISGWFSYSTNLATEKTIEIQGQNNIAASATTIDVGTATYKGLQFLVFFYPSGQESAVSPEQASWLIDANIGGQNTAITTAQSSYTEITNTTLDLVINSSKGSSSAEIACASGTASSGLTCSSNESHGIAFNPPYAGLFEVCTEFTTDVVTGGEAVFQLVETSNTSSAVIQEGGSRKGVYGASGNRAPYSTCGTFSFSDTSKRTIRLMYEKPNANAVTVYIDRSGADGQRDMHWTVRPILSAFNRPILIDTPVVSASYKTSTTSLNTTTQADADVVFTSLDFDPYSIYNTSTGIGTIPQTGAGKYIVTISLCMDSSSDQANRYIEAKLVKNGSTVVAIDRSMMPSSLTTELRRVSVSKVVDFSAGDTFKIVGGASFQQGAKALGCASNTLFNSFTLTRIGK